MLDRFFTDISSANWPISALRYIPSFAKPRSLQQLADRSPHGVPTRKIVSFPRFGLGYACKPDHVSRSRHWVEGGREFAELIIKHGLGHTQGVYTFTGAGLELLRWARERGLPAVHDQIMASRRTEISLLESQRDKFPAWCADIDNDEGFDEYCRREAEEWDAASLILCGSAFVRDSIVAEGADPKRCVVLHYGANAAFAAVQKTQRATTEPLRVLFVGEVGLRKGAPFVFEAARALRREIQVRMVGKISCPSEVIEDTPENLELIGVASRSIMPLHYGWADILLLPSLCEGSAGSVFEALASGLPVICTPNSGSVVEDGVSGLIIRAADCEAIISALKKFHSDHELLLLCSKSASETAKRWSLAAYGDRLASIIQGHIQSLSNQSSITT